MDEPTADAEQIPAPGTPQDHAVRSDHVRPIPASRTLILVFTAILGLALVAVAIAVSYAVTHVNTVTTQVRHLVETNQASRAQRDRQIDDLTRRIQQVQANQTSVLCNAVIASIRRQEKAGMKPDLATTIPFLRQFGCSVPSGL